MTDRPGKIATKKQAMAVFGAMALIFFLASSPIADEGPVAWPGQGSEVSVVPLCRCPEIVALLAEQEQKNAKEFRQIKRDIAALTQQVAEPGMREIIGGIGYILGLFGVAAYVASREKTGSEGR